MFLWVVLTVVMLCGASWMQRSATLGAWMMKPPEEGAVDCPTRGMPEVSNKTMCSGKQLSSAIKLMIAALAPVDSATGQVGF